MESISAASSEFSVPKLHGIRPDSLPTLSPSYMCLVSHYHFVTQGSFYVTVSTRYMYAIYDSITKSLKTKGLKTKGLTTKGLKEKSLNIKKLK